MKEYTIIYYDKNLKNYWYCNHYQTTQLDQLIDFLKESYYYSKETYQYEQTDSDSKLFAQDYTTKLIYITSCYGDEWSTLPEDYLDYVKQQDACILSFQNFDDFVEQWANFIDQAPPFALIYRDDNDWIHLKKCNSQEEIQNFIKQNSSCWQRLKMKVRHKIIKLYWKLKYWLNEIKRFIRK